LIALPSDITEILIRNLQRYVAPHVSSTDEVLTVALVNFVLGLLAAEQPALPRLQLERHLALRPVLERVLRKLATAAHIEWVETEAGRLDAPFVLAARKRGVSNPESARKLMSWPAIAASGPLWPHPVKRP
jgi:hypothetical protein